jgi:AcrR family transcriptional regulator
MQDVRPAKSRASSEKWSTVMARRKGGDRREQILDVVLRLFAQRGASNVTTRQIAKAAGCG